MSLPIYSIRETMPYFVAGLRSVDEWKRQHARRANILAALDEETKQKYQKSVLAKSTKVDELIRFVEDTTLDINFMSKLPSIEKCLLEWWNFFVKDSKTMDQEQLRSLYYDLAYCLVEARTEILQKNAVAVLMRGSWTRWNPEEVPLTEKEFVRTIFILGHLMTTTTKLSDYVIFFKQTFSKLIRLHQSKTKRLEEIQERKRMSRIKRKSTVINALSNSRDITTGKFLKFIQKTTAKVTMKKNTTENSVETFTNLNPFGEIQDRFVEVLDRTKNNSQCLEHDPLLNDPRFQTKWKSSSSSSSNNSSSNIASISLEKRTIELNPDTNRFFPPLYVSQIKTHLSHGRPTSQSTPTLHTTSHTKSTTMTELAPKTIPTSTSMVQPLSTLVLDPREEDLVESLQQVKKSPFKDTSQYMVKAAAAAAAAEAEADEDIAQEILRRSLTGTVLKKRIEAKKKIPFSSPQRFPMNLKEIEKKEDTKEKKNLYLAIST